MARYTGPKVRISRRFNEPVMGDSKVLAKKNYAPGQHGRGKKRKQSEIRYSAKLKNKKQSTSTVCWKDNLRNCLIPLLVRKVLQGEVLLQLLEIQIGQYSLQIRCCTYSQDLRVSWYCTKHILVNGDVVNIPSYSLKPGDLVEVRERSKSLEVITESLSAQGAKKYNWLEWSQAEMVGKLVNIPIRADIPENINEQLIVELYSK